MPSTSLTDYQVLHDASFDLNDAGGSPNEKTLHFIVPDDFVFEDGPRKPILAFKILPITNCSLTVFMNHRQVMSESFDKSHTRGYWESFNSRAAFPEGAGFSNPVPVRVFLNSGKARFSDVIVWYQVSV